jgi:hypothetical protein
MSGLAGSKKRNNQKKCIILIGLLVLFVHQAGAEQKVKFAFGVYTGLSFGLENEYNWWESGHVSSYFAPDFHLGGYVQFNLSQQDGLQINVNYQHGSKNWSWSDWGSTRNYGSDPKDLISINLNGILNYLRLKNAQLYLLGGCGINSAFWGDADGLCFNFVGGTGVKIYSIKYPRLALNLGGTFHHLLGSNGYISVHLNYLRLNIGVEFCPNDHKD